LDIDRVTVPAFVFSFLVLKASLPGTADRCTVSSPADAEADEVVGLLEAEAADELDAGVVAELLLEPPHPATARTTPVTSSPIALPMFDLLIRWLILANKDALSP
jgi:hypothetical protein